MHENGNNMEKHHVKMLKRINDIRRRLPTNIWSNTSRAAPNESSSAAFLPRILYPRSKSDKEIMSAAPIGTRRSASAVRGGSISPSHWLALRRLKAPSAVSCV
jgi:hypothetical protein